MKRLYLEANDIDYKNLNYSSGDHIYYNFCKYRPLASIYLKLMNGYISTMKAEPDPKQINAEIKRLDKEQTKKEPYTTKPYLRKRRICCTKKESNRKRTQYINARLNT